LRYRLLLESDENPFGLPRKLAETIPALVAVAKNTNIVVGVRVKKISHLPKKECEFAVKVLDIEKYFIKLNLNLQPLGRRKRRNKNERTCSGDFSLFNE